MRTPILLTGFTLTALFSAGSAFGADPRLLNLVMPDASTMAGANVTNAEITPFGQYVLARIASSMNQPLQNFITATGFDPIHDVSEILAATSGNAGNGANPSGVVLALGTFPVSQLTAAISSKAPNLTVQTYGGATLISGTTPKKGPGFSVAFLGDTIGIAGDTPSVKAAIDRSAGVNSINPALAVQVQNLSTTEDAWAVTDSPVTSLIPGFGAAPSTGSTTGATGGVNQFAQMFSSIQSSSGGVKFGSVIQITGQAITNDPANATALANVVQALVSIASMSGTQNPEMANIAQLLQGLKVTADGTAINLALSIPETQMETILNSLKNQAKPAVRVRIKPAFKPALLRVN